MAGALGFSSALDMPTTSDRCSDLLDGKQVFNKNYSPKTDPIEGGWFRVFSYVGQQTPPYTPESENHDRARVRINSVIKMMLSLSKENPANTWLRKIWNLMACKWLKYEQAKNALQLFPEPTGNIWPILGPPIHCIANLPCCTIGNLKVERRPQRAV